jgi:hypothetical protein
MIYPNYLSCFKVVPEPWQRSSFSRRLFVPQNTAYIMFSKKFVRKNNIFEIFKGTLFCM